MRVRRSTVFYLIYLLLAILVVLFLFGEASLMTGCGHGGGSGLFEDRPVTEDDGSSDDESSDDCIDEQTIIDEPDPVPAPIPMEEGQ